jgi:hypothetical protein
LFALLQLSNVEKRITAETEGGPLARSLPLCGPLLYRKAIHPIIIYFVESGKGLLDLIIDGMSAASGIPTFSI